MDNTITMRIPLAIFAFAIAASGYAFDKIIVIGDSLSDMGNISAGTLGIQPGSSYWQGRFSNGKVWIERLAERVGLPLARSGASGTNWAFGGAESGTGTFGSILFFPNARTQVTRYLNTNPSIGAQNMFVVWAGANDYFDGQTNTGTPVANIQAIIQSLHTRGARQFLVPNLPLLGNIPSYLGGPDSAAMNSRSVQHNAQLSTMLVGLRTTLAGVTITEMDVASNLNLMQTYPPIFGLTNVTQPALVGSTVNPNQDQFLFFDDVHPTRIGHQALSDLAFDLTSPAHLVSGTVSLGDWVGGSVPVTLRLWRGPILVDTYVIPSGAFSLPVAHTGTYSLTLDADHWLRRRISVNLTTAPYSLNALLVNGDANNSGEVDAADIDAVIADFGGSAFMTDLDGSGETDAADIDLVISHFGAVAE